jgi:hypothetical protein
VIEKEETLIQYPAVKEQLNLLKETVADDLGQLKCSKDPDAKVGHKTADSSFFGYKTHLAMSEERIITAAVITTGEKSDGKQLHYILLLPFCFFQQYLHNILYTRIYDYHTCISDLRAGQISLNYFYLLSNRQKRTPYFWWYTH